jgi:hypothetical protein
VHGLVWIYEQSPKSMYLKEIELYAEILPHVLGSIVDIMGGAYMIIQEVIESPL